jgi:2-amino-4-hydroxy-6-hydroxymethyldihydropteridine diphosphokinase
VKTVYLALGSNVGDREARLRDAVGRLEAAEIHLLRRSPVYETEPQDVLDQAWFLNAVLEAQTELFPMQLLSRTQQIERAMGRQRIKIGGPRTIDIDILLYGNFVISTPQLEVPHPRMTARRFVLEPLAAIAPDLRHPGSGKTAREMLAELEGQQVVATSIIL